MDRRASSAKPALTSFGGGVDMIGVAGNYVHRCVLLGNTTFVAVSIGGNWYTNTFLHDVNSANNPLASVIG